MPFIPAALLPAIIGGGAAVGSTVLGAKLAKSKPSPLEQQTLEQTQQAQQRGSELSRNLFDLGQPSTQAPMNYWASLLRGNRSGMTSALAPEVQRIGEGYKTAAQTSAALQPRGGPTPTFLAEAPYQQQRDVSTLFQQARPQAAEQLASSGSNLIANAINALYGTTAAGRDILGFEQRRREQERAAGKDIGSGIYELFYPSKGQPGLGSILGDIFKTKPTIGDSPMPGTGSRA